MAYSIDFRENVLKYINEGNSLRKAREIFKVSLNTIQGWKRLKKETGSLQKKSPKPVCRVYNPEKSETYIKDNPTAYLKDIAKKFGGSVSGAGAALQRMKIRLKKGLLVTKNVTKKEGHNFKKI